MSFGRSRARRVEAADQRVTFDDVAGIDEAKEELTEIVDFLKNPDKYLKLGGRIPRGVLLSGPPGHRQDAARARGRRRGGRAVLPDVGVGVRRDDRRRRRLARARPVRAGQGRRRPRSSSSTSSTRSAARAPPAAPNISGGHDEREQTLNQILTEMDGFDPRTGVIVLGATNRPEILDPALLRPGRFDRRVVGVSRPTAPAARRSSASTRARCRSPPTSTSARSPPRRPGMVGADLANLVNEAALLAARRDHEKVNREDLTDALERIVLGAERKVMISEEDRRRTAYHEAGHAIVGMLTPGADPVRKVSIIPRGQALGVTFSAPDADRFNFDAAATCSRRSRSRSAAASPRRSCSATSRPAPSPTSSS